MEEVVIINTPYKIHISYNGEHNGWLNDMLDLISRLYDMDSPYSYRKISISIEIDGLDDTGALEATVHYSGSRNISNGATEYE